MSETLSRLTGLANATLKKLGILKEGGNIVVGKNVIEAPAGQVTDTTLIGENEVVSETAPGAPVVIKGNKLIGKNKITIE